MVSCGRSNWLWALEYLWDEHPHVLVLKCTSGYLLAYLSFVRADNCMVNTVESVEPLKA